jgi:hypothetical protein
MATPLPAANCAKVIQHWNYNGTPGSNAWELFYSGAWDAADAANIISGPNLFADQMDSHVLPSQSFGFQGVNWEVIDLADPTVPAVVVPHATVGGTGANGLPNSVTLDVYWPVSSRIRGGRSHSFLTGFTNGELDGANPENWGATVLAGVLAFATQLRTSINATIEPTMGHLTLGVIHRHRSHALLTPPVFEHFLAPSVVQKVRSRSRRLPR